MRDLVGYGRTPPTGTWPGGARVALSLVVNVEEGAERTVPLDGVAETVGEMSRVLAPGVRDLAVESVFEYGSRAGTPRLLRLADRLQVPLTIFAAAQALEATPDTARRLADAGHEICAHGYRWAEAWTATRAEQAEDIARAAESIERLTGARPAGWYSRWMPSEHTRELIVAAGFGYDSDSYADDLPYWVPVGDRWHLVVPYTLTLNDMRFPSGLLAGPADLADSTCRALDFLLDEDDGVPRMASLGLHGRISGQPSRASAVADIVAHARTRGVWIATRGAIADHWRTHQPPPGGMT